MKMKFWSREFISGEVAKMVCVMIVKLPENICYIISTYSIVYTTCKYVYKNCMKIFKFLSLQIQGNYSL